MIERTANKCYVTIYTSTRFRNRKKGSDIDKIKIIYQNYYEWNFIEY